MTPSMTEEDSRKAKAEAALSELDGQMEGQRRWLKVFQAGALEVNLLLAFETILFVVLWIFFDGLSVIFRTGDMPKQVGTEDMLTRQVVLMYACIVGTVVGAWGIWSCIQVLRRTPHILYSIYIFFFGLFTCVFGWMILAQT